MILFFRILVALTMCIVFTNCTRVKHNYVEKGNWVRRYEGETIGGYTRLGDSIYAGYADSVYLYAYMWALKGVDVKSFKVCKNTGYAKDIQRVYYPLKIVCEDAEDGGGCYFEEYIIEKANPVSFKYIGDRYATDGEKLFYEGREVDWSLLKQK